MTIILGSICNRVIFHSVKIVGFDYYHDWKLNRAVQQLAQKTYP